MNNIEKDLECVILLGVVLRYSVLRRILFGVALSHCLLNLYYLVWCCVEVLCIDSVLSCLVLYGVEVLCIDFDCIIWSGVVVLRYWVVEYQQTVRLRTTETSAPSASHDELNEVVSDLYREVIAVPYLATVTAFSRRHSASDGRLQMFCLTDDRPVGRTLERRDGYVRVATIRDIEVTPACIIISVYQ